MHVLMLLAEAQPSSSRVLCQTLQRVVDEDRVWVYYRMTPLIPMLRLTDLRRAGCELQLPEGRTRASVPGQEHWVSAVRLLGASVRSHGPSTEAPEIEALLHELARDDFAFLRQTPPLLYHNDLSATIARHYWSEDVGYALWLRLYYQHAHLGHRHLDG
jgi:hypothetical protein